MIKTWLITANAPVCGTETVYRAYSEVNPEFLDNWDYILDGIIEDLWDSYSWMLHLEDDEYESEEDENEAYDQAWEDWRCDCDVDVKESTEKELEDVAPGGDVNAIEIVYDERKNDSISN